VDVIVRERADIGCVMLTSAVEGLEIAAAASAAAGVELPRDSGAVGSGGGLAALWLSPRCWIIRCAIDEEPDLVARLSSAFPDKLAHATVFTDSLCWLELSGARALELLTDGGFVSLERDGLPVGHAKRTLIAQVAALVVRERESTWLVAVERSRARYFVTWLKAACAS
jgi:heterotetrameric sarcosine oxidase gamma subunit